MSFISMFYMNIVQQHWWQLNTWPEPFWWDNPAETAPPLIDTSSIQSMQAGKIDGYLFAVFLIKNQFY